MVRSYDMRPIGGLRVSRNRTAPYSTTRSTSMATRTARLAGARRVFGATAARGLARAIPYVGAAVTAAEVGNALVQAARRPFQQRQRRFPGVRGRYAGKFKKSSKKRVKKLIKFLNNGFVDTEEICGTVDDPDCVYLQHGTVDANKHIIMSLKALLRKLIKKAIGWNAASADDVFPVEQNANANALKFEMVVKNELIGALTKYACESTPGGAFDTINKVAAFPDFDVVLRKWASGSYIEGNVNVEMPIYLRCYILDFAPLAPNFRLQAQIDLRCENVHVYVKSEIKIQNRSVSATGGQDADDVSNCPLVGYKYDFNSGTPVTRQDGAYLLSVTGAMTGVNLVRAAQLPTSFREPPLPAVFLKCSKAAKIRLNPGDIKNSSIVFKSRMKFLDYIKKVGFRYPQYNVNPLLWKNLHPIGKCQLYALEDLINVNANELIRIGYEVNRELAMYCTSSTRQPSIGTFSHVGLSNNGGEPTE